MAQVFGPAANGLAKFSIVLLVVLSAGGLCVFDLIHKASYTRYTGVPRNQPVPFSHKHHVNMGIDCRYCHTGVEDSNFAGIPSTETCMNCHKEVWSDASILEPVRKSFETGEALRNGFAVNDLPDHVYFNHSIHVAKGIGCATCHGPVDEMPLTWREHPLFMKWCLECHRAPEKFIRPKEEVFNMDYEAPHDQLELGKQLMEEYQVDASNYRLTDCWICHR